MKIPELNSFQLNRTETGHAAKASFGLSQENYARTEVSKNSASFGDYLLQAFQSMNDQQIEAGDMQKKVITDPDSVDLHDVTIAMSKARMSLNLANSIIDRIVSGWSEITTTR